MKRSRKDSVSSRSDNPLEEFFDSDPPGMQQVEHNLDNEDVSNAVNNPSEAQLHEIDDFSVDDINFAAISGSGRLSPDPGTQPSRRRAAAAFPNGGAVVYAGQPATAPNMVNGALVGEYPWLVQHHQNLLMMAHHQHIQLQQLLLSQGHSSIPSLQPPTPIHPSPFFPGCFTQRSGQIHAQAATASMAAYSALPNAMDRNFLPTQHRMMPFPAPQERAMNTLSLSEIRAMQSQPQGLLPPVVALPPAPSDIPQQPASLLSERRRRSTGTAESDVAQPAQTSHASILATLEVPKRARSMYNYFFQHERRRLLRHFAERNQPVPNGFLTQELGRRWKELDIKELRTYKRLADEDQRRHRQEKARRNRDYQERMTQCVAEQRALISDNDFEAYIDRERRKSEKKSRRRSL